jgi:translation initiation factor 1
VTENSRIVYSTDAGRIREDSKVTSAPVGDGIVRIRRERKGRGGKAVCVITGLGLAPAALKQLAGELKQRCGAGGAVRQCNIEIQGDKRDLLKTELEKRGFAVKLAGG